MCFHGGKGGHGDTRVAPAFSRLRIIRLQDWGGKTEAIVSGGEKPEVMCGKKGAQNNHLRKRRETKKTTSRGAERQNPVTGLLPLDLQEKKKREKRILDDGRHRGGPLKTSRQ